MKLSSRIYQTLLLLYRRSPFQSQIAHILRALPINTERYYRDLSFNGTSKVKSTSTSFLINHRGSSIDNQIFWKGLDNSFEKDTIWLWKLLCKEANVILDIGANTGIYSLIAKSENPTSLVVAFEPSLKVYPELVSNIELNNFDVKCEKLALSNSNEIQTFFDSTMGDFPSSGSLSAAKLKERTDNPNEIYEYEVTCSTLDNYLKNNEITEVDLIKIDIELHEPELFEGFKSLKNLRPTIIVEILTQDIAERLKTIVDLSDYRLFRLSDINQMVELSDFSSDPNHINYLLLPSEKPVPKL